MQYLKALHILAAAAWVTGLVWVPLLLAKHAAAQGDLHSAPLTPKARRLYYYGMATPGALLALMSGIRLTVGTDLFAHLYAGWFHAKLILVLLLCGHHFYCGKLLIDWNRGQRSHSHTWLRQFSYVPVVLAALAVLLALVKPGARG